MANNTKSGEIAYGVIAGIVWLVWMAAAVYGEIKRARTVREKGTEYDKERTRSDDSQLPATASGGMGQRYA